jgi:hypothetical protein
LLLLLQDILFPLSFPSSSKFVERSTKYPSSRWKKKREKALLFWNVNIVFFFFFIVVVLPLGTNAALMIEEQDDDDDKDDDEVVGIDAVVCDGKIRVEVIIIIVTRSLFQYY